MRHATATLTSDSGFGVNDDRILVRTELGLYVIADGAGPTYGGHYEAVGLAAGLDALVSGPGSERLEAAMRRANSVMHEMAATLMTSSKSVIDGAAGRLAHSAGSMTALAFEGDEVTVAQVGACRAYVLHEGGLEQLLPDHTLGTQLAAEGRGDEHPHHRFVCTRMLGTEPEVEIDCVGRKVSPGETYLLCTDGLWGAVSDEEILSILAASTDLDSAAAALVDMIGPEPLDDITVVVVGAC